MDYSRLGLSGLTVSRIGLGLMSYGDPGAQSWALREDDAEPIVRQGVLPDRPRAQRRGLSRKHVLAAIGASLSRLGTDYVDMYQVHRFDDQTPVEETMAALHDVVQAGKARYIGASAMYAWQPAKAQHAAATAGLTGFIAMQNRYNLVNREDERDGTRHTRRAKTDRGDRPADLDVAEDVRAIAAQRGLAPGPARPRLAALQARSQAPLIGATSKHHVDDAVAALTVRLDDDEIARLEARYLPRLLSDYS